MKKEQEVESIRKEIFYLIDAAHEYSYQEKWGEVEDCYEIIKKLEEELIKLKKQ